MSRLCSAVLAEVERTIGSQIRALTGREPIRELLDIGCWEGDATARYAASTGAHAHGVEIFDAPAAKAAARGVEVARLDLECEPLPWSDGSMDLVIVNQVLEHLKNVWLPMSEIVRVTRPGGWIVISVPNLASLHNRILLALGRQPTSIRTLGPHVRGFTPGDLRRFITLGDRLELEALYGVGFHPVPAAAARPIARLWAGGSHTLVAVARKRAQAPGAPWLDHLRGEEEQGLQTFYPMEERASSGSAPDSRRSRQAP